MASELGLSRDRIRDAVHLLLARGRLEQADVVDKVQRGARTFLRPCRTPTENGGLR
jgi:hypothetical protein